MWRSLAMVCKTSLRHAGICRLSVARGQWLGVSPCCQQAVRLALSPLVVKERYRSCLSLEHDTCVNQFSGDAASHAGFTRQQTAQPVTRPLPSPRVIPV